MSGSRKWIVLSCVVGVTMCWGTLGCSAKEDSSANAPAQGKEKPAAMTPAPTKPGEMKPAETKAPEAPAKPMKAGFPPPAVIKMCAKAPELDGDLSDACWRGAEVPGLWIDINTGNAAKNQPKLYVCYDDKNLYIAFSNPEPRMKSVVANNGDRDGNSWEDDSNEIFLDASAGKKDYFQFVVNSKNALYDGKEKDGSWNSNAKTAVKKADDGWTVEMSIPLADLGVAGSAKGMTWKGNFCRNRHAGDEGENMSWCDTGTSYHNPDAFGTLKFE